MRIKKQYESIINLNSVELYLPDADVVILDKLRKIFEGKCYKSSLIFKIIRIIRRSSIHPAQNLTDGSGNVNVVFEAESIIYNENDIITNCVVKNVERSGELICKIDHAAIHIRGNVILRGIQIGQTIPIRVMGVRYSKGKDNITINATPYFHPMGFFLYKTDIALTKPTEETVSIISDLIQSAEVEETKFNDIDVKVREFFTNVFYPFNNKTVVKEAKFNQVNMVDDAKRFIKGDTKENTMFVMRHPITDKSKPLIYHVDESVFKGDLPKLQLLDTKIYDIKIVRESYAQILINYLEEYIGYLRMIQELVETFDTEEKRQAHKNIWAIYNRIKH